MRYRPWSTSLFLILVWLTSCQEIEIEPVTAQLMEIPTGFPEVIFPEGNEFTQARWELGKKLFYDPVLSLDSSLSCASCHKQTVAFSDDVAFSSGVANRPGTRNSPSLANVAYHPYFTREGGLTSLEMQVLVPLQEHNEFDFNIVLAAERLAQDVDYVEMSRHAYDREPDPFVITRAIATFERSLISGNSAFDQFVYQGNQDALDKDAEAGMELFFGKKLNCGACHGDFNFTNYAFENNGLYAVYADQGRFRLTNDPADSARFKVPSLRNIALTAPYMHDGSMQSLEEVIAHYQSGGKTHPQKSELIQPFSLSNKEKKQLIAFLESLTDWGFVENEVFRE